MFKMSRVFHLAIILEYSNYHFSHSLIPLSSLICSVCVKSLDVSGFAVLWTFFPFCWYFQFLKFINRPSLCYGYCPFSLCVCSPLNHPGFFSVSSLAFSISAVSWVFLRYNVCVYMFWCLFGNNAVQMLMFFGLIYYLP